jgi:haloacetate dehalogenase
VTDFSAELNFFDGFALEHVDLGEATLRVRHGGSGPPVVLLHGHPRTHATWHAVAPLLAEHHTVVCPDLRGYGGSSKPPTTVDHAPYGKRAMGGDIVALMARLGHERFAVAGHDRGCYVALRTALDHPDVVTHLVAMEGVPIVEALERCDAEFARRWFHWFFFARPAPLAEEAIAADPERWYGLERARATMPPAAFADFAAAVSDPATVHAMLEDYRAGLGVDAAHERADREAGRRVRCPTRVLWAMEDDLELLYGDPLAVWAPWVEGPLDGRGLPCGHHMAEAAPTETAAAIAEHLALG